LWTNMLMNGGFYGPGGWSSASPGGGTEYWVITYNASGTLLSKTRGTLPVGGNPSALAQFIDAPVTETTDYDEQGRVISTVDFGGREVRQNYVWNATLTTGGLAQYGAWQLTTTYVDAARSMTTATDSFGRQLAKSDLAGTVYTMTFDKLGRLTRQTNTAGQNLAYTYYSTNQVRTVVDTTPVSSFGGVFFNSGLYYTSRLSSTSTFGYDRAGNRTTNNYTTVYQGATSIIRGRTVTTTVVNENSRATYDALNRLTNITDAGDVGHSRPSYNLTREYDAVGNVRRATATYQKIAANQTLVTGANATETDDFWYRYDSMNRFVTVKGTLSGVAGAVGTTVVRGTGPEGVDLTYDAAGQRATATKSRNATFNVDFGDGYSFPFSYVQDTQERYTYTADGYLAGVDIAQSEADYDYQTGTVANLGMGGAVALSRDTRDAMGRITLHQEYQGGRVVFSRSAQYNNGSQVLSDYVSQITNDNKTTTTSTSYRYTAQTQVWDGTYTLDQYGEPVENYITVDAPGSYANGAVVSQSSSTSENGQYKYSNFVTNQYSWMDGPQQISIGNSFSGSQSGTTTSTFRYDASGHVVSVDITGQRAHRIDYVTSATGQVMARKETDTKAGTRTPNTAPVEFYFYVGGVQIGQVGNNGSDSTDYASAVTGRMVVPGNGRFANGATTGVAAGSFDQVYQPMSPTVNAEGPVAGSYTVRNGDTLPSIAAALWGDASLWYLIARTNGLSDPNGLQPGQSLSIPAKVANFHNTANTFRVYDPNKALGDVQPGAPKPVERSGGCGVFGAILLAVIAIAVAILVPTLIPALAPAAFGGGVGGAIVSGAIAGTLGSVVSQGVGLATGIQDKFSWSGVALGALSGAVGGGFGEVLKGSAVLGSKLATDIVRSALTSATTQGIAVATGLQDKFDWTGVAAAGVGAGIGGIVGRELNVKPLVGEGASRSIGNIGANLVSGMAGGIANAATRSVIDGTDFGDNLRAALPDIIGSSVGQLVAGSVVAANANANEARLQRQLNGTEAQREQALMEIKRDLQAEVRGLEANRARALRHGNLERVAQLDAQLSVLTDRQLVRAGVATVAARIKYGDAASALGHKLIDVVGPNSEVVPLDAPPIPPVESADPNTILVVGRRDNIDLKLRGDAPIGRVAVDALGYAKDKYEGYRRDYGNLADFALAGAKTLLTGGVAPLVSFGVNKGAEVFLPTLDLSILKPIGDLIESTKDFVGKGGGGILLDKDTDAVSSRDGGAVLFGVEKLTGVSIAGIGAIARSTYKGRILSGPPVSQFLVGGDGFNTFGALKKLLGSAGPGNEWHHIVEQSQAGRFGKLSIQNTANVVPLSKSQHGQLTGFYNSKQEFSGSLTVRQWLSTQSFDAQYQFGLRQIERVKNGR
jgi:YD repeat-containing protein